MKLFNFFKLPGSAHLQDLAEEAAELDTQNARLHRMLMPSPICVCSCQKKIHTIRHSRRHLENDTIGITLLQHRKNPKRRTRLQYGVRRL